MTRWMLVLVIPMGLVVGGMVVMVAVAWVAARRSVTLTPDVPPEWQPRTWGQPILPGDVRKPSKECEWPKDPALW